MTESDATENPKKREHGLRRGDVVELSVQSLAPGGDGVSRDLAVPVFIARVAPQDKVAVELYDVRKNFARGVVTEVIEPSPQRHEPPCKIFKVCGGCQWQHIDYKYQLEAKQDIVKQAIKHIGGLDASLVMPAIAATSELHYRNKAQFPVKHPHDSKRILAGYYAQGSHKLINVKYCPVQPEVLDQMLEAVKAICEENGISAYDEKSHKGLLRHIFGRYSFAQDELLVTLVVNSDIETLKKSGCPESVLKSCMSAYADDDEGDPVVAPATNQGDDSRRPAPHSKAAPSIKWSVMEKIAQILLQQVPSAVGVCLNLNNRRGNRIMGDNTLLLAGRAYITEELKTSREDFPALLKQGIKFRLSPASFFQVNTEQACRLLEAVADGLSDLAKPALLIDAYAGVGTMSIWLSQFVERVIAIEAVAPAVEDGRANLKLNQVNNVEFRLGSVEKLLPELSGESAQVVLLDPPRKGATREAIESVIGINPDRIIYVSCNPATLARDLKILEENGYKTKRIQPVDMFPQTYHVESVAVIDRIKSKPD